MKKLIFTVICLFVCMICIAQIPGIDEIVDIHMKNGKVIKSVSIFEHNENVLVYKKSGSLHDLLIIDIKHIETKENLIIFNENGAIEVILKSGEKEATSVISNADSSIYLSKTILYFMPFTLFTLDPHLLIGIKFRLNDELNALIEAGYVLTSNIKYGFQFRGEIIKNYGTIRTAEKFKRVHYYSFQAFYKYVEYSSYNGFFNNHTNKVVYGINFKLGRERMYNNNFATDFYYGFGVRYNSNLDIINVIPNITLGYRFGPALN